MAGSRRPHGFTLIELLVVISIISLLISILLPALGRARRAAMLSVDASNLRQFAIAINAYAADNNGEVWYRNTQAQNPSNLARFWSGQPDMSYDHRHMLTDYIPPSDIYQAPFVPDRWETHWGPPGGIRHWDLTGYHIWVGYGPSDGTRCGINTQGNSLTGTIAGPGDDREAWETIFPRYIDDWNDRPMITDVLAAGKNFVMPAFAKGLEYSSADPRSVIGSTQETQLAPFPNFTVFSNEWPGVNVDPVNSAYGDGSVETTTSGFRPVMTYFERGAIWWYVRD